MLVVALVFLAAYLAVALGIDSLPAWRIEIAVGGAALHGVLAIAMRHGLELACAGATRKAAQRIFGAEG
jgi:hypothetical protein